MGEGMLMGAIGGVFMPPRAKAEMASHRRCSLRYYPLHHSWLRQQYEPFYLENGWVCPSASL